MSRKADALLVLRCHQLPHADDLPELVGHVLDGFIFDDTKFEGNHPFPQCHYIYTSNLQEVVVEDGKTFLITRNTTYQLIGCGVGHQAAHDVYEGYKNWVERGPVSITGDPVA